MNRYVVQREYTYITFLNVLQIPQKRPSDFTNVNIYNTYEYFKAKKLCNITSFIRVASHESHGVCNW